ncbi:CTP synthase-like protein, partial [Tanacetum coccineum]
MDKCHHHRKDKPGKMIQVVPHITNAIQDSIERVAAIPVDRKEGSPDVCVIELGGTIGLMKAEKALKLSQRKLIDKEMEHFKISEKEKKTQASCKERLEQPPK